MLINKGKKMTHKHTAKKISKGEYLYRGYTIYRGSDYDNVRYVYWSIQALRICPITKKEYWDSTDAANTLADAKLIVDGYEDRKVA